MLLLFSLLPPLPPLSSFLSGDNLAKQNAIFREWSAMRFTPAGPEYQGLCILIDYEGCNANLITLDSQNITKQSQSLWVCDASRLDEIESVM